MTNEVDSDRSSGDELEMRIDLNVLEHLGLKMYTSLPSVVSEYVANAWDAWATQVDITVPEERMNPDYEITIADNGEGMTKEEVNEKFLVVGRNRRDDTGKDYAEKDGKRREVMGRKGIGKLAGFGVAGRVNIRTRKNGYFVEFELDYAEMREKAEDDPEVKTTYNPDIVAEGETSEADGTVVTLKDLHKEREQRPNPTYVRERLARRFSVLDKEFDLQVNEEPVTTEERNLKERTEFIREFEDEPINENSDHTVDGWIGTLPNPVPDDIQGGVVVMARGKLIQEPVTFGVSEGGTQGQFALQYLVGEVHADFIDEVGLISTNRNSVVWDKSPADELRDFLEDEIRDFCKVWPEKRKVEQMEEVKKEKPYQRYIEPLDEREQELADDFLGELARGSGYDEDILGEMASYVSSGVQQKSFSNLMQEIEQSNVSNTEKLVKLFDRYEVLDAMNSLRVVKGRFHAIEKFEDLIEKSEGEFQDLHSFVSDNPWLVDPRWDYLDEEIDTLEQLKKNFDLEGSERVGIVCLGGGDSLRIVEIKTPTYVVDKADLDRFKEFVDYLRYVQGSAPVFDREIEGYIIAAGLEDSRDAEQELRRMKMDDMRIRTYEDIKDIARRSHNEFLKVFERKAERTESEMLRSHLDTVERQTGLGDFL